MVRKNTNTNGETPHQFDELELLELSKIQTDEPDIYTKNLGEEASLENTVEPQITKPAKSGSGIAKPLLFLLLGGIAGVFAAPKVAPLVPQSIGKYLTSAATSPDVSAQMSQKYDELASRLALVENAKPSVDLSQVEGQIAELTANMEALKSMPASSGAGSSVGLNAMQAEIDALKSQTAGLIEALNGKLTASNLPENAEPLAPSVSGEATQEATETALKTSEAKLAIAQLKANLSDGKDISNDVKTLHDLGVEVPPALQDFKGEIVSTLTLEKDFGKYAIEAIRASIKASQGQNTGIVDEITTQLSAQLAGRSITPQEGMTPDAILSRAEDNLKKGNLEQSLAELSALPSEASEAMKPWVDMARSTLSVNAAIDAIDAKLSGN